MEYHIDNVTVKASQRYWLYISPSILLWLHKINSRLCLSVVSLKSANQLERIQKRSLRIIYADPSYSEALTKSSMSTFQDKPEPLCGRLLMEIVDNKGHKLHQLLPPLNAITSKTRNFRVPRCKTKRLSSSLIMHNLRLSVVEILI